MKKLLPVFIFCFLALLQVASADFSLTSSGVSSGGGKSSGGLFSVIGSAGKVTISTKQNGGSFEVKTGSESQLELASGYERWLVRELGGASPSVQDFAAVTGTDGIPNGVKYVFGNQGVNVFGEHGLSDPPEFVKKDVELSLQFTSDFISWTTILRYRDGQINFVDPSVSIANGEITHANNLPTVFYRYGITKTP